MKMAIYFSSISKLSIFEFFLYQKEYRESFTCKKLNSLANMHYIYISLLNEIGTTYDFY